MKKLFLTLILIITISIASFAKTIVEGKTYSQFGDYRIELTEDSSYIITYENTDLKVNVILQDNEKCTDYVVLSDKLSVKYVCNENYFGVEKLNITLDKNMNRSEYFSQKVILSGERDRNELENAKLIAVYFAKLVN